MNRGRVSLVIAVGFGVVLGVALTRASEPAKELKVETLLQRVLSEEFMPDREILIDLVEIPPHTTLPRHRHPGEEFHYYLEGEMEIHIDGEKTIVGKPGGIGHVPYNRLHTAVTKDKGGKALVFRVHKEGEPVRYLEAEDPRDTAAAKTEE